MQSGMNGDMNTVFGTSGSDVLTAQPGDAILGGAGDDLIYLFGGGRVVGSLGDDNITVVADGWRNQFHVSGGGGDDLLNLSFSNIDGQGQLGISHGHHAYGDNGTWMGGLESGQIGNDTFNFTDIDELSNGALIVGRIDDFDPTRDKIQIEGVDVDLFDPGSFYHPDVLSVDVVAYNGQHNDDNAYDQQWLLIKTVAGGTILYAIEGARVDMEGDSSSHNSDQEPHFLTVPPNLEDLQVIEFVDPGNTVPSGISPSMYGVTYVDFDMVSADVLNVIGDEGHEATSFGDAIAAGLNDDTVYGGGGDDQIWGGSGHDLLEGGNGKDTIHGGSGKDVIIGGLGRDTLFGELGDDTILGRNGMDIVYGGEGDDFLNGQSGSDTLFGGDGADHIIGGRSTDTLYGDYGNDHLAGWGGSDFIYGGMNNDFLHGNNGNDFLDGGEGNDLAIGGNGRDIVYGGAGADEIYGWKGDDFLDGGEGDDIVGGGNGNDTLFGGDGNDTLFGWFGDDELFGGTGADQLTGGEGRDVFYFEANEMNSFGQVSSNSVDYGQLDLVTDFAVGEDQIAIFGSTETFSLSDIQLEQLDIEGDRFFQVGISGSDVSFLVNVDEDVDEANFLTESNFIFL